MGAEVLLVAGTAVQVYGALRANKAEAAAEKRNAAWYNYQAEQIQESTTRELFIFDAEVATYKGEQRNAFATSGISGVAPLMAIVDTEAKAAREKRGIEENAKLRLAEARFGVQNSNANAQYLNSFQANALPVAGTILNNASAYMARHPGGKT